MPNLSNRPTPLTLEEIDADWLTTALRTRVPDAQVRAVEIVDVNRGTCTKIRLKLDLNDAAKRAGIPPLVILKGGFEPHSRDWHFMHEREVRGYRDVFAVHHLHSPACYFADYDAERKQGIIIMEDLVTRGVTFCNPQVPQTFDQVARRFSALAQFHAKTWNSPEIAPGGRLSTLHDNATALPEYLKMYLVPSEWQRFVDAPRGAAASVQFHSRDWMVRALDKTVVLAQRQPYCVIHGDTHLGNLYVEKDGTPGFFDPVSDRGPSMMEVSYHLGCALDPADRRRWERPLIQHYLEELGRAGVKGPSFDDAMIQYAAFLVRGYVIFLINESHFQPESINTAYTARFSAAMIDNNTVQLLKEIS